MIKQPAPQAKDFMTTHVHSVAPDTPLAEVIACLLKHGVSTAPVVSVDPSGERQLLGFLSERDCLEALSNEMFFGNPAQPQTAATMMQRHPVCVSPDTDVFTLASVFVAHGYRHLPVVSGTHFEGIVSRRDILSALDHYYRELLQASDEEREIALAEHQQRATSYRFAGRIL